MIFYNLYTEITQQQRTWDGIGLGAIAGIAVTLIVTIVTIIVVVTIVVIVIFRLDVGLWNCSNISCFFLQSVWSRKKTKSEESNVEYETLKSQDYIRMGTCERYSLQKSTSHKTQETECYNLKYDDI